MNEKELIVALELGSQNVRAIAGNPQPDGSFKVVRIEQVPSDGCIRRGVVYNLDKTVTAIRRVVERMEERLQVHIDKAYVGIQGQSLHTVGNFIQRNLGGRTKVDDAIVDTLLQANDEMLYPGMEILEVIPQEYKVGLDEVDDPVGIETETIEARFVNVVARDNIRSTIVKCVRTAGLEPIDVFVSPLALAERLLPESERRSGCALVDMGAETTTVMVFTKNLLRHMAVIPLGGKNITKDITTMQTEMDEAECESLKLRYGHAITTDDTLATDTTSAQSQGYILDMAKLRRIIEARCEEILRNVMKQIEASRMDDKLPAGIIFTGGGANIPDLCAAFAKYSAPHEYKLRVAKPLINSNELPSLGTALVGGNYNSLVALLTKGEADCTSVIEPEPEPEQAELNFDEQQPAEPEPEPEPKPAEPEPEPKPKGPSLGEKITKGWNAFWGKVQNSLEEEH